MKSLTVHYPRHSRTKRVAINRYHPQHSAPGIFSVILASALCLGSAFGSALLNGLSLMAENVLGGGYPDWFEQELQAERDGLRGFPQESSSKRKKARNREAYLDYEHQVLFEEA